MFGSHLSRIQSATLRRPGSVLAGCLVLAAVAAAAATQVEIRSSRSELAPADDPDQQRWDALLSDYRGSETVILCVEAARGEPKTDAELERFADRVAAAVAADPAIERVFHRIDADWLLLRGLHLVPAETLRRASVALEMHREFLADVVSSSDLAQVNLRIAARMREGFSGSRLSPEAEVGIELLADFVEAQRRFLEQPRDTVRDWTGRSPLLALAGEAGKRLANGYLKSHDHRTLFLLASPHSTDDSLPARRALLTAIRGHVREVLKVDPGFKVALTGTAAMAVEEMDIVRSDTLRTALVAVVGVVLLTLVVFRWKSHALLVLAALAVGILWSYGAVWLELGYLNLITSAFISTLVGVGVAYGIHPVSEYELEGAHTVDPREAVRESFRRTGPAVAAAGLTTAVAFFSIWLMQFRGFAELGIVAGVGVLLCLLSALVCLPAILLLYGVRRARRDRVRRGRLTALDRLWLERVSGRVCRFPRATVALCLLATVGLGWAATGIGFNTNMLDLMPQNAESLRYLRRVTLESDLSPVFNFVPAEDLDELRAMRERAQAEPAIDRFESILRFLPADPEATRAIVREWAAWLDGLRLAPAARPLGREELAASLRALESVFAEAADKAFVAGLGDLAGMLEKLREQAEGCVDLAREADERTADAWDDGQRALMAWTADALDSARQATRVEPPSLDNMPAELKERFFTRSGKPLGFLFPAGSVFERDELDAYIAASRRVSERAIGFPYMFHKTSRRITTGFYRAVAAGAVAVLLILLVDLRNMRHTLLAVLPLAVGLVWTLGLVRLFGYSFNFANLVAVPLIVGVGIDNGVHMIHRVRFEGSAGIRVVLRHTGRAILISSLTTMIGFGSLCVASHRGLASLGLLLLVGVGSCLVASILLLPNLLVITGVCPAGGEEDGSGGSG